MHFCLSSTLKNRHKTGTKASVCDVLHEKVYKTPVLPVHIVNEAFWKRCVFKRLLKAFLCLLYRQPVALFSELISAQWAQRRLITRFILESAMALMDVTKRGVPSYNFFCCKDHSYWLKQVLFLRSLRHTQDFKLRECYRSGEANGWGALDLEVILVSL